MKSENNFGIPEIFFGDLLYLMYGNELLHNESSGYGTWRDLPQALLALAGRQSALRVPADWMAQPTMDADNILRETLPFAIW
jgi:hypothetical protein